MSIAHPGYPTLQPGQMRGDTISATMVPFARSNSLLSITCLASCLPQRVAQATTPRRVDWTPPRIQTRPTRIPFKTPPTRLDALHGVAGASRAELRTGTSPQSACCLGLLGKGRFRVGHGCLGAKRKCKKDWHDKDHGSHALGTPPPEPCCTRFESQRKNSTIKRTGPFGVTECTTSGATMPTTPGRSVQVSSPMV